MIKIIKSNLIRVKKSKLFWIGCVGIFVFTIILIWYLVYINERMDRQLKFEATYMNQEDYKSELENNTLYTLNNVLYFFSPIIICVMSILCPIILGLDNVYGTIRNKIIAGNSRLQIYMSNVMTSIIIGVFYSVIWIVIMFTLGISLLHSGDNVIQVIRGCVLGILQVVVFAFIYSMIITVIKSTVISSICCVVMCFAMAFTYIVSSELCDGAAKARYGRKNVKEQYELLQKQTDIDIGFMKCIIDSGLLKDDEIDVCKDELSLLEKSKRDFSTYDEYLSNYDRYDYMNRYDINDHYEFLKFVVKANPIYYFECIGLNKTNAEKTIYTYDGKEKIEKNNSNYWKDCSDNDKIITYFDGNIGEKRIKEINEQIQSNETFKKLLKDRQEFRIKEKLEVEKKDEIINAVYCSASEMILYDAIWCIVSFAIGYFIFCKKNIK